MRSPVDNRSPTRRSVRGQSLRYVPLKARRTAFSVVLAILRRMHGEVQQPVTVALGHNGYESGLRGSLCLPPSGP
jgi:hypothetical protein